MTHAQNRFPRYAWGLLAYNLIVILWGAIVRATGSGAGCGDHWPLCDGKVVPDLARLHTAIEFAHRMSTGLVIPLVLFLLVWAWRAYPKAHPARLGAVLVVCFTFSEALLGAALVLYKLVEHDASAYRAIAMSAHLVNTLILVASLTLTAWWSSGGSPVRVKGQPASVALGLALAGTIVLAVSGAIAALGDTLFPVNSFTEALRQDFSPTAHFLIRLRLLHPILGLVVGGYVLGLTARLIQTRPASEIASRFARRVFWLFPVQIVFGFANARLLAPLWMQIAHLLLADLLWIYLVLFTAATLAEHKEREPVAEGWSGEPRALRPAAPARWKGLS